MKITDSAIRQAVTQWPMIVRSCPGYAWSWGHHNEGDFVDALVDPPRYGVETHFRQSWAQVEPYVDRPKSDRRWDKPGAGLRAITEIRW